MPKIYLWCPVVLLAAVTAACGPNKAADTTVAVTGTDTKCDVADASLPAGLIRFTFTNNAKLTNELYVLGDKDRVVKEVENILPGAKSHLDVSLKAGTYALVCKPGQTGDGIRQRITVTGVGGASGAAGAKADRTIAVAAKEYSFSFDATPTIAKGDSIEFDMTNNGHERHEFEVLGPDGKAIGEIAAIDSGTKGEAVFEFKEAGTYTYQCLLQNDAGLKHNALGMTGTFAVA